MRKINLMLKYNTLEELICELNSFSDEAVRQIDFSNCEGILSDTAALTQLMEAIPKTVRDVLFDEKPFVLMGGVNEIVDILSGYEGQFRFYISDAKGSVYAEELTSRLKAGSERDFVRNGDDSLSLSIVDCTKQAECETDSSSERYRLVTQASSFFKREKASKERKESSRICSFCSFL